MEQLNNTESLAPTRETIAYESGSERNATVDNIKDKVAQGLKSAAGSLKQKGQPNSAMSE